MKSWKKSKEIILEEGERIVGMKAREGQYFCDF
jgi:hypothetical protein